MFLPNVEFFSHHAIPLPARRTHPKLLSDSSSTVPPRCEQHADRQASRRWGASCWKYALEAIIEMIIFPCIHD